MKIPRTFIPEKNLEDKTHDFLRNEYFENKHLGREYLDVDVSLNKHVVNRTIQVYSLSSHVHAEASDELQITYHNEKTIVTINIPIFKEIYGREVHSGSHVRADKKLNRIMKKAEKSLENLGKHFDFTGLISKVQADFELHQEIEKIFKGYPSGEHSFKFKDNGYTEKELFYEEAYIMYSLYHKYLIKYVQKYTYNLKKDFWDIL